MFTIDFSKFIVFAFFYFHILDLHFLVLGTNSEIEQIKCEANLVFSMIN